MRKQLVTLSLFNINKGEINVRKTMEAEENFLQVAVTH
jgi:hypothetical protein